MNFTQKTLSKIFFLSCAIFLFGVVEKASAATWVEVNYIVNPGGNGPSDYLINTASDPTYSYVEVAVSSEFMWGVTGFTCELQLILDGSPQGGAVPIYPCPYVGGPTGGGYDTAEFYVWASPGAHTICFQGGNTSCSPKTAYFAAAPQNGTLSVNTSQCSGATWTINPGGYTGTPNTVPSGTYTIYPNPPSGYSITETDVWNTDGAGPTTSVGPNGSKVFYIQCVPIPPPTCSVDHFYAGQSPVGYGNSTNLYYGGGSNNACTSGTLAGGIYGGGVPLASNGYTYPGNVSVTDTLYNNTSYTYTVCRGAQCDSRSLTVNVEPAGACYPSQAPSNLGNSCNSSANACGGTNTGTIQCSGACSATTPANPAGYGNACTSSANVCGQTNTGTIQCNGTCSATTPSNASCNYTVSASAGTGGSISPSSRSVSYGANTTFTVTPNSGYWIGPMGGSCPQGSFSGGTWTTGSITSNCSVSAAFTAQPVMSGTLSASNCSIPAGSSSCNSSLSWNTSNPVASSVVTTPNFIDVAYGNSGSATYPVSNGTRNFYLYNNGVELAMRTASASCIGGTTWNGSICATPPPGTISVDISASPASMTLPSNSTILNWTTTGSPDSCNASGSWGGGKATGGGSESRTGLTAGTATFTITCYKAGVANASDTVWVDIYSAPPPGTISVDLSASPASMTLPTNSTNLSWLTTGTPDSCTASGSWSGSKAIGGGSENRTGLTAGSYTYTITCSKSGVPNAADSVTVQVNSGGAGSCSNIGTGGTITYPVISSTQYVVHTFNSPGTFTFTPPAAGVSSVSYLVVGGGGGGGGGEVYSGNGDAGGGGGAGGHRSGTLSVTPIPYSVTVGAGGAGGVGNGNGVVGGDSIFSTITSLGGGRGGRQEGVGGAGGSGGGGGGTCWFKTISGGSGTSGQGSAGGSTVDPGAGPEPYCNDHRSGSGGGGAGGIGGSTGTATGGNGGAGISSSITGSSITRAGGGGGGYGGGQTAGTAGVGGAGGGGAGGTANFNAGNNGGSGIANTGSGGGGGARGNPAGIGGNGGSGVVIVRYACVPYSYPDLIAGNASPSTATVGTPLTFAATISNGGPGSAGPSFSNFFQVASAADGGGTITNLAPSVMTTLAAGANANATSPSYTFSSPGTYSVRACADKSSATDLGTIAESNENNNCSNGWTNVTVGAAFDYSISSPTAVTVTRGDPGGATRNVSTTLLSGSSQPVSIINTTATMPQGLSVIPSSCTPSGIPCTSTLSIVAQSSAVAGNYNITISGNPLGATTQPRTLSVSVVNPTGITVTCSVDKSTALLRENVVWSSNPQGGIPPYTTYAWSGNGVPTPAPTGASFGTTYTTIGTKTAQVTVTDSVGAQGTCAPVSTLINFDPTIIEF